MHRSDQCCYLTISRLDIKFQKPESIYGIVVQGSAMENKFITSYKVLFSENGHTFSYVADGKKEPQVFRGPVDQFKPVEQKFYEPIEARVVRVNPLSWHNGIAMKVELLGCQEMVTTTVPVTESVPATTTMITEKIITPGIYIQSMKASYIELYNRIFCIYQCVMIQWGWTMV